MSSITMLGPRRRRLPVIVAALISLTLVVHYWSSVPQNEVVQLEVGENSVVGMCPHVQRPVDPSVWQPPWQLLEADGIRVYLYSAIFFTRHRGGGKTVQQVKVIAVGTNPRLYTPHCLLWYPGDAHPHTTPASVASIGVPVRHGNISDIHQYLLTCPLSTTNPPPTHVSVVTTTPCTRPHTLLPIHTATSDGPLHQYGVCVPAARGDWGDVHVVEWLEVQRAMGVSEFSIYHRGFSRRLQHTLQHYVDGNIVQLRAIPPPLDTGTPEGGVLLDGVSLTDCLLRNRARYRYLLVVDFNDVVVPRRARSYSVMMRPVQWELKDHHPDAFSFHSATFYTDCTNSTRHQSLLFRYVRRTEAVSAGRGVGFPLMVDPTQCVALGRDGCVKQSSTSLSLCWAVKPDVAISHHYQPQEHCDGDVLHDGAGTRDNVLMKYRLRVMAASPIKLHAWQNL